MSEHRWLKNRDWLPNNPEYASANTLVEGCQSRFAQSEPCVNFGKQTVEVCVSDDIAEDCRSAE